MRGLICIPTIGSVFTLAQPWSFMLYEEHRNNDFGNKIYPARDWNRYSPRGTEPQEVHLPEGTKLKVDRIYVRQGGGDFDSVTFRLKKGDRPGDKTIYGRFWVKLGDVNRIVCDWDEDTVKRNIHPLELLALES